VEMTAHRQGVNRPHALLVNGCERGRLPHSASRLLRAIVEVKAKRDASKRELIDTGRNKMFAKRDAKGQFKEMDDVGRSLAVDRRRSAKTTVKSGQGDQGDRPRAASTKTK
jgi:hypothetical protein